MVHFYFDIAAIISISSLFACLAVITRQPIIVAYIISGVLLGPFGFSIVSNTTFIDQISEIGVVLLLFLAGVVLHPRRLIEMFRQTIIITIVAGLVFGIVAGLIAYLFHFTKQESIITGLALMFSSTILVVKLLPTTTLHQKRMGSLCIAILVAQDLIAVILLMFLNGNRPDSLYMSIFYPVIGVVFIIAVLAAEQYIIRPLMRRVDYYHETLYLIALAWCFGIGVLAEKIGFSHEIGAFIAGLSFARSPISPFLSEGLKFFRDFFLVLFFFTLGSKINFFILKDVWIPELVIAVTMLILKPVVYTVLFRAVGEQMKLSGEMGVRLGQASEFSLILAIVAEKVGTIGTNASQMIQITSIITLIISSYGTVRFFPTPIGTSSPLKRD